MWWAPTTLVRHQQDMPRLVCTHALASFVPARTSCRIRTRLVHMTRLTSATPPLSVQEAVLPARRAAERGDAAYHRRGRGHAAAAAPLRRRAPGRRVRARQRRGLLPERPAPAAPGRHAPLRRRQRRGDGGARGLRHRRGRAERLPAGRLRQLAPLRAARHGQHHRFRALPLQPGGERDECVSPPPAVVSARCSSRCRCARTGSCGVKLMEHLWIH